MILTGGAARRFGGGDKPGALVGGRSLVERVAAAVAAAGRLVVVGERRELARPGTIFTREDPPEGGPVPAVRAGVVHCHADWVALLAGDLPFFTATDVERLLTAAAGQARDALVDESGPARAVLVDDGGPAGDVPVGDGGRSGDVPVGDGGSAGAVLVDDTGREQWLAGVWRRWVLVEALGRYDGRSLHGLLAPLGPAKVDAGADGRTPWFDCDTPADLALANQQEETR
ncbi:molybdenum cofactor guanylyltransferase [Acrocarpospora catenulata]|uniref:molybdenum cofactor guanylyltransferase n=1 Tax=Acrocarpospora catenulata TaxID=2836182 RepID=UPI0027E029CA|nr:NTP transferase domain-containing protein [Acrocarpospora catenulata]